MTPLISDVQILSQYQFVEEGNSLDYTESGFNRRNNPELLCIKKFNGREILHKIQAKDITTWNFFLRLFGKGKLGNLNLSVKSIAEYLAKYEWKAYSTSAVTKECDAYKRVCQVAGRHFIRNNDNSLWKKLSTVVHTKYGPLPVNSTCTTRNLYFMIRPSFNYLIRPLIGFNQVENRITSAIATAAPATSVALINSYRITMAEVKVPFQNEFNDLFRPVPLDPAAKAHGAIAPRLKRDIFC